jgi:hypothetical protein
LHWPQRNVASVRLNWSRRLGLGAEADEEGDGGGGGDGAGGGGAAGAGLGAGAPELGFRLRRRRPVLLMDARTGELRQMATEIVSTAY